MRPEDGARAADEAARPGEPGEPGDAEASGDEEEDDGDVGESVASGGRYRRWEEREAGGAEDVA
jgi:hypothetical protein